MAAHFDRIELVDRPWFPYLCTEVEYWEWETDGEPHFNFWLCLGGEGYLRTYGHTYKLRAGMFFIFSPNQSISALHTAGQRITRFSAHFVPMLGEQALKSVPGFPLLAGEFGAGAALQRQIDVIMRLAFRRQDEPVLHDHMLDLIQRACSGSDLSTQPRLDERVSQGIERMRRSPATIESMDALASALGCSRSHFDRLFTTQVGQPPTQFLLNCKMIEARRLLESSRYRIGEIAEQLGYRDIYFFSRQFKQWVGRSPAQYRSAVSSPAADALPR